MIDKLLGYCKAKHSYVKDDSWSIWEMLIKVIEKLNEVIDRVNELDVNTSEYQTETQVKAIIDARGLLETANFVGTWQGVTYAVVDGRIVALEDAIILKENSSNITDVRLLDNFGNFTGTWNGVTFTVIDGRITQLESDVLAKEDSINITNARLLDGTGNFTGTWFGETYIDFKAQITNAETLYQNVIDLINANPNIGVEVIDGEFIANMSTPTEIDGGLITDSPTEEIDAGLIIYPCICTP